jgi:hypothetical protein
LSAGFGFGSPRTKHPHREPMSLEKDPRWKRESSSNNKAAVGFRRRFSFPAHTTQTGGQITDARMRAAAASGGLDQDAVRFFQDAPLFAMITHFGALRLLFKMI